MALKVLMEYGIIWYISRYPVQSCIVGALFTCVGCFLDQFIWSRGSNQKKSLHLCSQLITSDMVRGYGLLSMWWLDLIHKSTIDLCVHNYWLVVFELMGVTVWTNTNTCTWIVRNNNIYRSIFVIYTYIDTYLIILSQWPLKMYGIFPSLSNCPVRHVRHTPTTLILEVRDITMSRVQCAHTSSKLMMDIIMLAQVVG